VASAAAWLRLDTSRCFRVKVPVPARKTARKVVTAPQRVNEFCRASRVSGCRVEAGESRLRRFRSKPKASEDPEGEGPARGLAQDLEIGFHFQP
jgi:hypothetical protein